MKSDGILFIIGGIVLLGIAALCAHYGTTIIEKGLT